MSCYIVNDTHIAYIASVALGCLLEYDWGGQTNRINTIDKAIRLAEMMRKENNASFTSRYENRYPEDLNDDPIDPRFIRSLPHAYTSEAQIYKAVDCYQYQSCEHPEWMTCQVKAVTDQLKERVMSLVEKYKEHGSEYPVGYDAAEWGCCPKFQERCDAIPEAPKLSPLMQQWQDTRNQLPNDMILLWGLGDFYELFHDDAPVAAKATGLTITHRNGIPMAGIPAHVLGKYSQALIDDRIPFAVCDINAAGNRSITYTFEPKPLPILSLTKKKKFAIKGLDYLTPYMSRNQRLCLRDAIKGEEAEYFCDTIADLVEQVVMAPRSYDQDGMKDDAIVHFHYFVGSYDGYITELDKGDDGDMTQHQAFGYVRYEHMSDCASLGYISLPEIFAGNAELDLHWKPITLGELKESLSD